MKKIVGKMILLLPIIGGFLPIGINTIQAQDQFGSFEYVGGVGVTGAPATEADAINTEANDDLIQVIKNFINWVLGILSLITLVILLWGGFQMVTAAGDEGKFKSGFKILKQAAIGLAFIGLSWFIVSIIFWIIGGVTTGVGTGT